MFGKRPPSHRGGRCEPLSSASQGQRPLPQCETRTADEEQPCERALLRVAERPAVSALLRSFASTFALTDVAHAFVVQPVFEPCPPPRRVRGDRNVIR